MPICGYSSVSLPPRYHPHYHLITTLQMAKHGLIVYIVGKNTSSARRNVGAAQKLFMLFFLINNPRCFSLSRTKKRTEVRFPASHLSPFAFHLSPFTFHLSPISSTSVLTEDTFTRSPVPSSLWLPAASRRSPISCVFGPRSPATSNQLFPGIQHPDTIFLTYPHRIPCYQQRHQYPWRVAERGGIRVVSFWFFFTTITCIYVTLRRANTR